jgi:cysteine synthase A
MTSNRIFSSILQTIGNTPVVRINRLAPAGVEMFVKVEAFNPMGSVKDRMALSCIEQAERDGTLQAGQTVIEATSGNTGIGLAMVCAAKGYPLVLTMAESFSIERRKILRFLGARVILTPAELKGSGMVAKAEELADKHGWFLVRQFENEANADAHSRTTAVEILQVFADQPLDFFVTGYGTGGTFKGTARVLKEKSPQTKIVVCEPDNSPLLGSGIAQQRDSHGKVTASHPSFRPHLMQGWTPDFIPSLVEEAIDLHLVDLVQPVDGNQAMAMARELAQQEGIFCGTSAGATFAGALQVARSAPPGSRILCMLPDTGERYLSTPLFEPIGVEMNAEEFAISQSTPSCRFDVKTASSAPEQKPQNKTAMPDRGTETAIDTDVDASNYVESLLHDPDQPLVFFALEWCEFCWSVRKLFKAIEVPYRSVDLDSVKYQENDLGGRIRAVLKERNGVTTIPQIFIAGQRVGGATDTFDAWNSGQLQKLLQDAGISFKAPPDLNPFELLPGWLHSR